MRWIILVRNLSNVIYVAKDSHASQMSRNTRGWCTKLLDLVLHHPKGSRKEEYLDSDKSLKTVRGLLYDIA